ncbi:MAG: leucine-rich repeat domain-containing protein [Clostridia bacterium]|nr:leucine-rich repeat domain-containing protein [Clostridia bacterium]
MADSVTAIGSQAFQNCTSLVSITMGDGVTTIESSAFLGCSVLETVTISSSLESVGQSAFAQCGSIKGVYVTDVSAWCGIDFYDSDANPLSVAGSLYVKGDLMAELEIPSGVTAINPYAFYGCSSLTSVILPISVTEIGSSAFSK